MSHVYPFLDFDVGGLSGSAQERRRSDPRMYECRLVAPSGLVEWRSERATGLWDAGGEGQRERDLDPGDETGGVGVLAGVMIIAADRAQAVD